MKVKGHHDGKKVLWSYKMEKERGKMGGTMKKKNWEMKQTNVALDEQKMTTIMMLMKDVETFFIVSFVKEECDFDGAWPWDVSF